MNILVIGANGLLGRNLIKLLSENHRIYALVRNRESVNFRLCENIVVIEHDLSKMTLPKLPGDIDAVFYLAQSRRFREFPDGVEDMMAVNVYGPVIFAKWASQNKVKIFVYASSGGVYANVENPLREDSVISVNQKIGFYLSSKLSAEILIKNFSHYFQTFAILRPFFIYGVGQDKSMLIPRLIENVKNGGEIILSGDEGIRINPIYVEDAALAVSKVLNLKGEHLINIAGKEIVSIKYIAETIGKFLGKKPVYKYINEKQRDIIADIEFMRKNLHEPKISIEEGLRLMIHNV